MLFALFPKLSVRLNTKRMYKSFGVNDWKPAERGNAQEQLDRIDLPDVWLRQFDRDQLKPRFKDLPYGSSYGRGIPLAGALEAVILTNY